MSDIQQLEAQLGKLKPWQLTAFAAALTERMLPNFTLFSRLLEFGDAQQVRRILDGVWEHLAGGASMNFEVQLDHVEDNMPSLDEFDMYGAMPALDAVVALYSTLVCILESDPAEAANIADLSRECVATFIEVNEADPQLSDAELMRFIAAHDLMQDEDAFQEEVLERLQDQQQPNKAFIRDIRELAGNQGVSNLGISDNE
ncbi:YjaG family protein [Nitrincola sp.]|uniref:YjaG family protein n=1 Tax=Nitrincola sp. TaxID=1926584 RepID=UPI003A9063EF